uniref:EGF-like domain-containing protein n=1 Tax=Ascaris lumbricoides TaxID=6252 RepID=A0A0M3ISZ1_ASCLU
MECHANTCGANADCFVTNHQINCVCRPGYTGDPWKGCSMKTVKSCMSGDPHYTTFDGQGFDYMGTCPYVFVEPCNATLPKPYNYFSVKAKNEQSDPSSHVSMVREVEVLMYGQKFHVDCKYNLFVNDIRTKMPFYYPNKDNATVSATYDKGMVTILNDQHIRVTFQCYYLCVEIPDEAALQGADVLCGLAGNRDFDCRNDFRKKDGTIYEGITSCNNYGREFTEEYGDTYITEDFLSLTQKPQQCLTGVEVTNGSITCELAEAKAKCLPILDAAKGNGVFAACKPLGEAFIKQAYDNCAYDTCQNSTMLCDSLANFARICQNNIFTEGNGVFAACKPLGEAFIKQAYDNCAYDTCQNSTMLCDSLANFARICQNNIFNTPLTWRHEFNCSEISCPLNAERKACATGCPRTCSAPEYNPHCDKGCAEGCECEPPYVLDNSKPDTPLCVLVEDCGCIDPQGNYHSGMTLFLIEKIFSQS